MARKPSSNNNPDELRGRMLKILVGMMDEAPPLGEQRDMLLKELIRKAYQATGGNLEAAAKKALLEDVFTYATGFGPIQGLLDDPLINEIMVNGPNQIYIEKGGQMVLTRIRFDNEEHLRLLTNSMTNPYSRFVNSKHPTADSHLPDGSRINIVIPPVAQQGSCISIRKFLKDKFSMDDLIRLGSMSQNMAEFLVTCVKARLNLVIAGNTSSGKTTLLNILAGHIPNDDRIIVIEDSVELQLHQTHKISLEAKPPDHEGEGQVTIRDLVRNALRMRPDRIIVGEVRGGETLDMLQAMNTGHDGSMTTVHSNSPRDTLARLETTTLMAGIYFPVLAIRKQIASSINLIVFINRFPDGSRKITHITEVNGMEGDVITMTDLFVFEQKGLDKNGKTAGNFKSTGLRPMFMEKLQEQGYRMDSHIFGN